MGYTRYISRIFTFTHLSAHTMPACNSTCRFLLAVILAILLTFWGVSLGLAVFGEANSLTRGAKDTNGQWTFHQSTYSPIMGLAGTSVALGLGIFYHPVLNYFTSDKNDADAARRRLFSITTVKKEALRDAVSRRLVEAMNR